MRSSCALLLSAAAISLLSLAAPAHGLAVGPVTELSGPGGFTGPTTAIDFDGVPDATIANTYYLAQGVQFENTGAPVAIYDYASVGRVTTSSPNVISTEANYQGTGSQFSAFLDLLFASPTMEVGAYFGNDQGPQPTLKMQLSVFDASNALIGLVQVDASDGTSVDTSVDQFAGLRSNSTPFYRARFEYLLAVGNLAVALDDVRFTTPVPEPGSLALVGLGLGLLAYRRRRK